MRALNMFISIAAILLIYGGGGIGNGGMVVQAQSRCMNACQNSPTCYSGLCTMQSCTDTGTCYEYCLNCSGVTTCYASGYGCSFNASTGLHYSMATTLLAAIIGLSYLLRRS